MTTAAKPDAGGHNHLGNCWDKAYVCPDCMMGSACDVCHKHEQPRGECDECPDCPECPREDARVPT